MRDDVSSTTLILLGHGSTTNANSANAVHQHAAEIRKRQLFAEVKVAFWKQEPVVAKVLFGVTTSRAFIVPLFISEGYFTEHAIPEKLGFKEPCETDWSRILERDGKKFIFTKPVGTHGEMTDVLLARATKVLEDFPFPRKAKAGRTSLFIAGHGTKQNADSRKAIERQVELIREQNIYSEVLPCFLEEEPLIADVPTIAQSKNIVIVPFFISDGLHTVEDIPILLGEPEKMVRKRLAAGQPTWRNPTERNGKLVWYAPAVGTDPLIAEVVIARVRENFGD